MSSLAAKIRKWLGLKRKPVDAPSTVPARHKALIQPG
jgi:hypothetical protein